MKSKTETEEKQALIVSQGSWQFSRHKLQADYNWWTWGRQGGYWLKCHQTGCLSFSDVQFDISRSAHCGSSETRCCHCNRHPGFSTGDIIQRISCGLFLHNISTIRLVGTNDYFQEWTGWPEDTNDELSLLQISLPTVHTLTVAQVDFIPR